MLIEPFADELQGVRRWNGFEIFFEYLRYDDDSDYAGYGNERGCGRF
jgi:hypothetical protein